MPSYVLAAPPNVTVENEITAQQGRNVSINCTVEGDPDITITWYDKNGGIIQPRGRYTVENLVGRSILTINDVDVLLDDGVVTCEGNNSDIVDQARVSARGNTLITVIGMSSWFTEIEQV